MTIREEIMNGMALAFFACAYADQAEECDQPLGGEIMDQLPDETDSAALHAAKTLAFDMERKNGKPIEALYQDMEALPAGGSDRQLTPDLFGHYCAMQAMGTGVGLESFGDAVENALTVPYCEFGSYSLERDYFQPLDED